MHIEKLEQRHDGESFTCGEVVVDDFIHFDALTGDYGDAWVVVDDATPNTVIAFYTIDLDPAVVTDDEFGELPIGVIYVKMMGVSAKCQRQGIGTRLFVRIVKQALQVANTHLIDALLVTAISAERKQHFLRAGFGLREAAPGSLHLLLPVGAMRTLPFNNDLRLPPEGF